MSYFLADKGYIVVKPETTPNTAVRGTIFLPLESSDVKTDAGYQADRRMRGLNVESNDLAQGQRSHRGTIKLWGDPDTLGHALNMTVKKGSTTGNGSDGYTHPFTVDDPKTYSVEIPEGPYARRFFGLMADSLKLSFEDQKLKISLAVEAAGQFSSAVLSAAITGGSGVTLKMDQEYDLEPSRGLATGDTLTLVKASDGTSEDVTIGSISSDGVTLTLSVAPVASYSIGDTVYLKRQTPSFATLQNPLMFGDMLVGIGATASAAATAAASKSTSASLQEVTIDFKNNLLKAPTNNYRDPSVILPQVRMCDIAVKQLLDGPSQVTKYQENTKVAIVIVCRGKIINATTPTRNQLTLTFNKCKLLKNDPKLQPGEYVLLDQTFKMLYDDSDAQAFAASLVNLTSTY